MAPPRRPLADRFWDHVHPEPNSGCWLFDCVDNGNGYSSIYTADERPTRRIYAHRLSYEMHRGPIPKGKQIDHICRVRSCVNPDHLRAVTAAENSRAAHKYIKEAVRRRVARKTHCVNGHPYSPENTRVGPKRDRICRACMTMHSRAHHRRRGDLPRRYRRDIEQVIESIPVLSGGKRVIVCGGRAFRNKDKVYAVLDALHAKHGFAQVLEGGANGTDVLAAQWAKERGVSLTTVHADWKRHGHGAGPRRNQRMLSEGQPHLVVAFPGGRGTADMMRRAREAGVPVIDIASEGA